MPVRLSVVGVMTCLALGAACGGSTTNDRDTRTAGVYAAVLRSVVPAAVQGKDVVIYVAPFPDQKSIQLETQAAVIAALVGDATVRFVDELPEAVNDDAPGAPAKEGFVLVLGRVPASGTTVELDAERYESETAHDSIHFRVTTTGDRWTAEPVETRSIPPTTSA